MVSPEKDAVSVDDSSEEIEVLFELICRFATELRAEYVALFDSERRGMEVVPKDRPIADVIDRPPRLGVYSYCQTEIFASHVPIETVYPRNSGPNDDVVYTYFCLAVSDAVLSELGGIEGLFETPPWSVAELGDGRTLVIESGSPWKGWRPPTEASYIVRAWLNETDADVEKATDSLDLSDPFAALSPGDFGVDACVSREAIAAEFRNEDLQAVRVYVDDDRNLRRVADDSFVRNVVTEASEDEAAIIKGMLAEIPADADSDRLMVSALLHGAIPPSFVRLDDPNGENVISRVLALDVETNKTALLVSLGKAARGEGMDAETIESALANLAALEDVEGIESWIEQNLLSVR